MRLLKLTATFKTHFSPQFDENKKKFYTSKLSPDQDSASISAFRHEGPPCHAKKWLQVIVVFHSLRCLVVGVLAVKKKASVGSPFRQGSLAPQKVSELPHRDTVSSARLFLYNFCTSPTRIFGFHSVLPFPFITDSFYDVDLSQSA